MMIVRSRIDVSLESMSVAVTPPTSAVPVPSASSRLVAEVAHGVLGGDRVRRIRQRADQQDISVGDGRRRRGRSRRSGHA